MLRRFHALIALLLQASHWLRTGFRLASY
jgi:hypothetical protein